MFSWLDFIIYAVVTSITPGPNNIICMTNGRHLGIKKSLPFNFGVVIGVFILLLVCAWIGSTVSSFIPAIRLPMTIIGALYILYLAFKTFTSKNEINENHKKTSLFIGIILQFVNPKAYLYSIVSMELYILPYFQGDVFSITAFAFILIMITFFSTICWTIFGTLFTKLFSQYAKTTNTLMALLLLYCAVSLFI